MNQQSIAKQAVHGVSWHAFSSVISIAFQVTYTAVISRLLLPGDFGCIAIVNTLIRFTGCFSKLGLEQTIVQRKDVDDRFLGSSWLLALATGLLMFLAIVLLAPLLEFFFHTPGLTLILRVSALAYLISAFSVVPTSLMRRNFRFRALALIEMVSYIFGYGLTGILLASLGKGVWSLVFASLLQPLLVTTLSLLYSRAPIRVSFSKNDFKDLLGLGSRFSLLRLLEFLSSNLDTLLIARLYDGTSLGLYNRAFLLATLPIEVCVGVFTKVAFPLFSKLQHDRERFKKIYLSSALLIGTFSLATALGMSIAANETVAVLFGDRWQGAIPIVKMLLLSVPFVFLSHLAGVAMEAMAEVNHKLKILSITLPVLAILFILLAHRGPIGFAQAFVLTEIIRFFLSSHRIARLLDIDLGSMAKSFSTILAGGGAVVLGIFLVAAASRSLAAPPIVTFASSLSAGLVGLILVLLLFTSLDQNFRLLAGEIKPLAKTLRFLERFTRKDS